MSDGETTTKAKIIKLRHPEYAGLEYGPDKDTAIVFGNRAGLPAYEAWVPEDHPLLEALLEAHPEIEIITDSGPAIMWACPIHPNSTFKTKNALLAHMRGKGHGIAELAEAAGLIEPSADVAGDASVHVSSDGVIAHEPELPPANGKPGK